MKQYYSAATIILFVLTSFLITGSTAQNISINAEGSVADQSAMLDVKAANKGLLIPRVKLENIKDDLIISNPAPSLLVYNTNIDIKDGEGVGYYYNAGTALIPQWVKLVTNENPAWLLKGNEGVNDQHFIGSINSADLILRTSNEEVMRFTSGGALLATGNITTGTTPVNGDGVRMMFIPATSAFRAGKALLSRWDDENIGDNSFATGSATMAKGVSSTAMGHLTIASDDYSTALGFQTNASSKYATAMGNQTTASGTASASMGYLSTASGPYSLVVGYGSLASGWYSSAFGIGAIAEACGGVAIGTYNEKQNIQVGLCNPKLTDKVFQIGNGTGPDMADRKDILYVLRNGNMRIAGTLMVDNVFYPSDERLKENIEPLTGILNKIKNIQPIFFDFKDKKNYSANHQIGFSAQQIQKQFPELVNENEKEGFLSVNYSSVSAVLMQAIKEQQEIIQAQNKKNNDQQKLIEQLISRMERMEKIQAAF